MQVFSGSDMGRHLRPHERVFKAAILRVGKRSGWDYISAGPNQMEPMAFQRCWIRDSLIWEYCGTHIERCRKPVDRVPPSSENERR